MRRGDHPATCAPAAARVWRLHTRSSALNSLAPCWSSLVLILRLILTRAFPRCCHGCCAIDPTALPSLSGTRDCQHPLLTEPHPLPLTHLHNRPYAIALPSFVRPTLHTSQRAFTRQVRLFLSSCALIALKAEARVKPTRSSFFQAARRHRHWKSWVWILRRPPSCSSW